MAGCSVKIGPVCSHPWCLEGHVSQIPAALCAKTFQILTDFNSNGGAGVAQTITVRHDDQKEEAGDGDYT